MLRSINSSDVVDSSGRLDDSNITIVPPDWEVYIQQVADAIIAEQSPQRYHYKVTLLITGFCKYGLCCMNF